ncbi:MAG: MBL fold metallo-hydrolase [bacterium]|nr:MBL fold metallo-hydrolase [bacterium]
MQRSRNNLRWYFLGVLAFVSVFIWYAVFYAEAHRRLLSVHFFDIGQGDAIFVEAPNGNQILVDGGPDNTVLAKLGETMPFWDRSIDVLVLSHPHADHLDGLVEVVKRYDVGVVIESGANHTIPEYAEWHALLREKNIPVVIPKVGERIDAGGGVALDVLSPLENFEGVSPKNIHDANVVGRLMYASTSVLLMGDAEEKLEYRLLYSGVFIDSDVLKVGHHGSKTSTSEEFLRAVSPEIAVIQVGRKNRYGHPYQGVLDRLAAFGVRIFRNDLDGDILLQSDGVSFIVNNNVVNK